MWRLIIAVALGCACALLAQVSGCSLQQPVEVGKCVRDCLAPAGTSMTAVRSQREK